MFFKILNTMLDNARQQINITYNTLYKSFSLKFIIEHWSLLALNQDLNKRTVLYTNKTITHIYH